MASERTFFGVSVLPFAASAVVSDRASSPGSDDASRMVRLNFAHRARLGP
jgi:hypothetical protein